MTSLDRDLQIDPSEIDLDLVDEIAWAFEGAWDEAIVASSTPPDLESYLLGDLSAITRQAACLELALIDIEHRLKLGETARAEEYTARFEGLVDDPEGVKSLLKSEYRYTLFQGHDPEPGGYAVRFARHWDDDLAAELRAIRDDPANDPIRPRFRVIRLHGEGGLGRVYEAFDREIKRRVALKEIRPECADRPDFQSRFIREAEITGRLDHPGIASVYSLGRHDGRPFYAMRFIRGEGMEVGIARLHAIDRSGRERGLFASAMRDSIGRLATACNAVAHAHSRGVVHRDLKPQNIMVGPFGETQVVDWGLAKVVGRPDDLSETGRILHAPTSNPSDRTMSDTVLGTPGYMSPEQVERHNDEVGPASDIYNLGATLYAILTGKPPFNLGPSPSAEQFESYIAEVKLGRFVHPRQITDGLDPALEAICLKAMATRSENRYITALDLATDLEGWLGDEPNSAYREPWTRRTRRWTKRHRMRVVTGSAIMAIAITSIIAWTLVGQSRRIANVEKTNRDKFYELARSNSEATIGLAEELKPLAGTRSETVAKVLDRAGQSYDALLREAGESSTLLEGRAKIFVAFAEVKTAAGDVVGAAAKAREASEIYRKLLEADPKSIAWGAGLARARSRIALALMYQGKLAEALPLAREALERREELSKRAAGDPGILSELAASHFLISGLRYEQGDLMTWAEQARVALEIREELGRRYPENLKYQGDLASSVERMASVKAEEESDNAGARIANQWALGLYRSLAERDTENVEWQRGVARGLVALGQIYQDGGEVESASRSLNEALELSTRFSRLDPVDADWVRQVVDAKRCLSDLSRGKDRIAALGSQLATIREFIPQVTAKQTISPQYQKWSLVLAGSHKIMANNLVQLANIGVDRESNIQAARKHLAESARILDLSSIDETSHTINLSKAVNQTIDGDIHSSINEIREFQLCEIRSCSIEVEFFRAQRAREPERAVWSRELARNLIRLSNSLGRHANHDGALDAAREALSIFSGLASREPNKISWIEGSAQSHDALSKAILLKDNYTINLESQRLIFEEERKIIEDRARLTELDTNRPSRLKDLAIAHDATVSTLRILGQEEAAEAAFSKRLEILRRLHDLDASQPWGDILAKKPSRVTRNSSVSQREISRRTLLEGLIYRRKSVAQCEFIFWIHGGFSRLSESLEGYLELISDLDLENPSHLRETRRVLGRARSRLKLLQAFGELRPIHKDLLSKVDKAFVELAWEKPPVELDDSSRILLADVNYAGLADRMISLNRGDDLLSVFAVEAQAAEDITWLVAPFSEVAFEPKRVEFILAVARLREKAGTLDGPLRRRLAELARAIGEVAEARRLAPDSFDIPAGVKPSSADGDNSYSATVAIIYRNLSAQGRYREGIRALRELMRVEPGQGPIAIEHLTNLAISELSSGHPQEAERTVTQALALAPDSPVLLALRGWVSFGQRRFPEAREQLRGVPDGLIANNPFARIIVHNLLFATAIEQEDFMSAEEILAAVKSGKPDDPSILYLKTYLDIERGRNLEASEASARRLHTTAPGSPDFQSLLGWALSRCGRAREGLPLLKQASLSESFALDPVLFEHLGDAHQQLAQVAEARQSWLRAMELIPKTATSDDRRRRSIEAKLRSLDVPLVGP